MPQESQQAQDPNHTPQAIQPALAQLAPQIEEARQTIVDVDEEEIVAPDANVMADVSQILQPDVDLMTLGKDAVIQRALQRLADGGAQDGDFVAQLDHALLRHEHRRDLAAALARDDAGRAYVDARVRAATSRGFITTVLKGYFELSSLQVEASWDLAALKSLWSTLQMVPDSHVRERIQQLILDRSAGGDHRTHQVNIGKPYLRPLSRTVGGAETNRVTRSRGNKFLMQSSPYSDRMRSKQLLMAISLHEVGHAVDYQLRVPKDTAIAGRWEEYDTSVEALTRGLIRASGHQVPVIEDQTINTDADVVTAQQRVTARQTAHDAENTRIEQLVDQAADRRVGPNRRDEDAWHRARVEANRKVRGQNQANFADNFNAPLTAAEAQLETAKQKVTDREWYRSALGIPQSSLYALIEALAAGRSFNQAWVLALATGNFEELLEAANVRPAAAKRQIRAMPMIDIVIDGAKYGGWQRKRSELDALAEPMGGRVFHKTAHDPGKWVSYEVAARDIAVSHYQFHAPNEWFAELYSHFYAGTMQGNTAADPTHPLFAWFETNIARRIARDTVLAPMPDLPQQQEQE